jgi:translation initiation factor IF-2
MPALESRSFAPHSGFLEKGFLEKLRERPLLAGLALGTLISTLGAVALLKQGDGDVATPSSGALSPAEAAPPVAAHPESVAPAPERQLAASPQIHPFPADSAQLPAGPPVEPAQQRRAAEQPVHSMRALRPAPAPSPRAAPPPAAAAPSPRTLAPTSPAAPAPAKHTDPKKPRPVPAAQPLNPFDTR